MYLVGCKHNVHFKGSGLLLKAKRDVHIGCTDSQKQGVVTELRNIDYKQTTNKACVPYKIISAICYKRESKHKKTIPILLVKSRHLRKQTAVTHGCQS